MLKDVFVGQTHLGLCLNVSPLATDFCGETLQLLEQLSLPRGGSRMPGLSRYESLHLPFHGANV